MNNRCNHVESNGFHLCGSYAFNLEKDGIEQGDLCDVHYWQDQALSARAEQPAHHDILKLAKFAALVMSDKSSGGAIDKRELLQYAILADVATGMEPTIKELLNES